MMLPDPPGHNDVSDPDSDAGHSRTSSVGRQALAAPAAATAVTHTAMHRKQPSRKAAASAAAAAAAAAAPPSPPPATGAGAMSDARPSRAETDAFMGILKTALGHRHSKRKVADLKGALSEQLGILKRCKRCTLGTSLVHYTCRMCRQTWHPVCYAAQFDPRHPLIHIGQRRTERVCPPCQRHDDNPTIAATLRRVVGTEWRDMWDKVEAACHASPSRRRFRGRDISERTLFVQLLDGLLTMAESNEAAELAVLYLPRFVLAKRTSVRLAITHMPELPSDMEHAKRRGPCTDIQRLEAAVSNALELPAVGKLINVLDRQPSQDVKFSKDDVLRYYPQQHSQLDEHAVVQRWIDTYAPDVDAPVFTKTDLRAWAFASATSSGGELGWTGDMIKAIIRTDTVVWDKFAEFVARPPDRWRSRANAHLLYRGTTGWMIPSGPKLRPIAAPSFVRRAASRALMRKARASINRYAVPRGQVGMAKDDLILAYSILPQTALKMQGSVVIADRSMSFQTLHRSAVINALDAYAKAEYRKDPHGVRATLLAAILFYNEHDYFGEPFKLTTVGFEDIDDTITVHGLAQGCTSSPNFEAIALACAAGAQPQRDHLVLQAHDDVTVSSPSKPATDLSLPDCSKAGGEYNASKGVATGRGADAAVDNGVVANARLSPTLWGRPLHNFEAWYNDKYATIEARVNKILELHSTNPHLAIRSACKVGGPRAMLTHALRATPPGDAANLDLTRFDRLWNYLLYRLALQDHASATALAATRPYDDHAKVTGGAVDDVKTHIAYDGTALAFRGVTQLLKREVAVEVLLQRDDITKNELANECKSRPMPPRTMGGNTLWAWALCEQPDSDVIRTALESRACAAPTVVDRIYASRAAIPYALAMSRALDLPFARSMYGPNSVYTTTCDCGGDWGNRFEHAASCAAPPYAADFRRRHNLMVSSLVKVAKQCGAAAEEHDARIPTLPSNHRPADWLEEDPRGKHRCCDLTIVLPENLHNAVENKREKYKREIKIAGLKLNVFGVDECGNIAGHTSEVMKRWTSKLRATRYQAGIRSTDAAAEVRTAVALIFAHTMAHWWAWHNTKGGRRYRRRRLRDDEQPTTPATTKRARDGDNDADVAAPAHRASSHQLSHDSHIGDRGHRTDYALSQRPIHSAAQSVTPPLGRDPPSACCARSAQQLQQQPAGPSQASTSAAVQLSEHAQLVRTTSSQSRHPIDHDNLRLTIARLFATHWRGPREPLTTDTLSQSSTQLHTVPTSTSMEHGHIVTANVQNAQTVVEADSAERRGVLQ